MDNQSLQNEIIKTQSCVLEDCWYRDVGRTLKMKIDFDSCQHTDVAGG